MAGGLNLIDQITHFCKARLSLQYNLPSLCCIYIQSTQQPANTILIEASIHLNRLCLLVGPCIYWLVGPFVGWLVYQLPNLFLQ